MWIRANPNGSLERETNNGTNTFELSYPGYYDCNTEASGGWDKNAIYVGGQIAGRDVAWLFRNGTYDDADIYTIVDNPPAKATKNYNIKDVAWPEEYFQGSIFSPKLDASGNRHMAFQIDGIVGGWSIPQYDDFIVIKCRFTNQDDDTIKNFYYARWVTPDGPYRPSSVSNGWDKEYLWDPAVSDTLGFIFYDDNTIPATTGIPNVYTIPPGNVTGNCGDPGNIGTQNSRNFKLYSPSLYAFSFLPYTVTANKFNERKIWRKIISSSSNAPADELMPSWNSELRNYATLVDFITKNEQPHVSWKDAYQNHTPLAGSLWERNPRYIYAIGPYDIAPRKTIEWMEIFICGQMDRNITMRGDTTSTRHFVAEGLRNLKDNWNAARTLIKNNLRIPTGEIPPPTPADAPKLGNTVDGSDTARSSDLVVEPSSIKVNGVRVAGVNLTFNAVHRDLRDPSKAYTDPQTRKADFAKYRIYQSDNSIEGPWTQIDSISVAKADSFIINMKDYHPQMKYFVPAKKSIPYRYCVTSVDSSGNESGMTGYSYYPVAAEPDPSNQLSDILVVPNPFRQVSGLNDQSQNKRLTFYNIPEKCTIRIYTVALDLVRTIEHNCDGGTETWGTSQGKDYMLTDFAQNVMPGVYIYHVESHVPGHEGESSVGKFIIIK
jgi:hypothetical protein